MSMTVKQLVLIQAELLGLLDGSIKPKYSGEGLCEHIDASLGLYLGDLWEMELELPREWHSVNLYEFEHYSGDELYLVKHPSKTSYRAYQDTFNLWDITAVNPDDAEYARRRWLFCQFLADKIDVILEETRDKKGEH